MFKRISFFLLLAALMVLMLSPSLAQDDPDPEAEINALARQVAIFNERDGNATRWVGGDSGTAAYWTTMAAGGVFPQILFADFDGELVKIKEPERPLLINFWASWCGPCIYEFPVLLDYAQNDLENADFLLVNVSDSQSSAISFLQSQELGDIQSYVDQNDQFIGVLGLRAYPTTILLDRDGRLLIAHTGTVSRSFLDFADMVAAYPDLGSLAGFEVSEEDLIATIESPILAEATPLALDASIEDRLDNERWQHNYSFEGKAGQEIQITMSAAPGSELDPYLVLIGPDGERVAEDDDGFGRPDSRIRLELPSTGTYILVATRFLEADSLFEGEYRLVLQVIE